MSASEEPTSAELYRHSLRPNWGLAIVFHEGDGKRHYLFQDGQRRVLTHEFEPLMTRVVEPTAEQTAIYAVLRSLAAAHLRDQRADRPNPGSEPFDAQLSGFRAAFPAGFSDTKWVADYRAARDLAIERARAQLGMETLDALLSARDFGGAWALALSLLGESGLLPPGQLKQPAPRDEALHELAVALRGLLSDDGPYAARFDRYVLALTAALGKAPSWELATLPSALLFPSEHVYVELSNFRRLIRASRMRRAIPAHPSGAVYAGLLALARSLLRRLGLRGEAPRDLLDIRDFVAVTLAPARAAKLPPVPRAATREQSESRDE